MQILHQKRIGFSLCGFVNKMLQLISNCLLVEGIQISHTEVEKSELHYHFHSFSICGFYDFFWNRFYFFIVWHNSNFDRNGVVLPHLHITYINTIARAKLLIDPWILTS